MAEPQIARQLSRIHQVLEIIAFLLAVLVANTGSLGLVAGVVAAFVIVLNRGIRFGEDADPNADR